MKTSANTALTYNYDIPELEAMKEISSEISKNFVARHGMLFLHGKPARTRPLIDPMVMSFPFGGNDCMNHHSILGSNEGIQMIGVGHG